MASSGGSSAADAITGSPVAACETALAVDSNTAGNERATVVVIIEDESGLPGHGVGGHRDPSWCVWSAGSNSAASLSPVCQFIGTSSAIWWPPIVPRTCPFGSLGVKSTPLKVSVPCRWSASPCWWSLGSLVCSTVT